MCCPRRVRWRLRWRSPATPFSPRTCRPRGWELRADGFGRAHAPDVLLGLARGGTVGDLDLLLVAVGTGQGSELTVREDLADHPRVRHAHRLRTDVRVWGDDRGFFTLAEGLAGRREMSVEAAVPGRGTAPR